MIYRNGKLILNVQQNISDIINQIPQRINKDIGAIYKGSQLIWLTVYNAVRSCFGGGTWRPDKPWKEDDFWKNN